MEKYWPEKKVRASSRIASGSDGEEVWQQMPIHRLCGRFIKNAKSNIQFSSVAQSCPTLCDHMNRSTPGLPVHHQLPEFTQTHVRVSDAIPKYL